MKNISFLILTCAPFAHAMLPEKDQQAMSELLHMIDPLPPKKKKTKIADFGTSVDFQKMLRKNEEPLHYGNRLKQIAAIDAASLFKTLARQCQLLTIENWKPNPDPFSLVIAGKTVKLDGFAPSTDEEYQEGTSVKAVDVTLMRNNPKHMDVFVTKRHIVADGQKICQVINKADVAEPPYDWVDEIEETKINEIGKVKNQSDFFKIVIPLLPDYVRNKWEKSHLSPFKQGLKLGIGYEFDKTEYISLIDDPMALSVLLRLKPYIPHLDTNVPLRPFNPHAFLSIFKASPNQLARTVASHALIKAALCNVADYSARSLHPVALEVKKIQEYLTSDADSALKNLCISLPHFAWMIEALQTSPDDRLNSDQIQKIKENCIRMRYLQPKLAKLCEQYAILRSRIASELASLKKTKIVKAPKQMPAIAHTSDGTVSTTQETLTLPETETSEQQPEIHAPLRCYDPRIERWFHDENFMQQQSDDRILYHGWSTSIDPIIMLNGYHQRRKNHTYATLDDHYSVAAQLEYKKNGTQKKEFVVVTLCINENGVCYHRGFERNKFLDLYQRLKTAAYPSEFPTLQQARAISAHTPPLHMHTIQMLEDNDFYTKVFDPRLSLTMTIFKIPDYHA